MATVLPNSPERPQAPLSPWTIRRIKLLKAAKEAHDRGEYQPRPGYDRTRAGGPMIPVGYLRGRYAGRKTVRTLMSGRIRIALNMVFKIGRHRDNDLVLTEMHISQYHLRISAFETTAPPFSLVEVIDISTNGVIINGVHHTATSGSRSIVLIHGDEISFPKHPEIIFTYEHNMQACGPDISAQQPPMSFFPDKDMDRRLIIKDYTIYNIILGSGSNGTVYLGCNASKQVAIKYAKDTHNPNRANEAKLLKQIKHHNLQALLEVVQLNGYNLTILVLFTGGDLFAYLDKYGPLTEKEVSFFTWQLVKGLKYIHGRNIAHRGGSAFDVAYEDIKPENILLATGAAFPRVVLVDFGEAVTISTLLDLVPEPRGKVTRPWTIFGTVSYIAPELLTPSQVYKYHDGSIAKRQAIAQGWLDEYKSTDIWAVACVVANCLCMVHPYTGQGDGFPSMIQDTPTERTSAETAHDSKSVVPDSAPDQDMDDEDGAELLLCSTSSQTDVAYEETCRQVLRSYQCFINNPSSWTAPRWKDSSVKDFLQRCLDPDPSTRMDIQAMRRHPWLIDQTTEMREIYVKVVRRGIPWFQREKQNRAS